VSQFSLTLDLPAVFSTDNFYLSASNQAAFDAIMRWPQWEGHALYIHGPDGMGKSHLGHIWLERAHAARVPASALVECPLETGHVLVENVQELVNETALFHLFNHTREQGYTMLLTANCPASDLPFSLPDLTSRLIAVPSVGLQPPDDELLAAALRKLFSDRQLKVEEDVIQYILPRIERTLASVQTLVARLDSEALASKRSLTVPFVRKILES